MRADLKLSCRTPPGGHMKSNHIKILAVALALTLMAAIAGSQTVQRAHHMHGDGMFGEHMLAFFADYLSLSDAQQAQIKDIRAEEKPTLQPIAPQMPQIHHD